MVPVLDHGHVRLVSVMGDDLAVVNAARVSFNKQSHWETIWEYGEMEPTGAASKRAIGKRLKSADARLISFLATNGHWSPFAHQMLSFEVKCPMLVKNQWIKHRIGMSYLTDEDSEAWDNEGWNEMSMRYVEPTDFYQPEAWRSAPENKKQGSGPNIESVMDKAILDSNLALHIKFGIEAYNTATAKGVAPEQARVFLPMYAMYTSFIWTTSLYGVVRFLELRTKEDAQYEIREFANAVHSLAKPHFPESFAAFGL